MIAELVDHRTLAMTKRYAHPKPQVLQEAVEKVAQDLEGAEPYEVMRLPVADWPGAATSTQEAEKPSRA